MMSQNAVTPALEGWALFLNVDGALLETARTPREASAPDSLKELLNAVCSRMDGALALVSGRSIADLDALFAPLRFSAAGVHGCERRHATGCLVRPDIDVHLLDRARETLRKLVDGQPELLLEDKRYGLAVHFRRAPQLRHYVRTIVKVVANGLGTEFVMAEGDHVCEIRPSAWSTASAIAAFLSEPPFRGRTPVFLGNDVTDEEAFGYVNSRGGISIRIGTRSRSLAKYTLGRVSDAVDWLKGIPPVRPPISAALTFRVGGQSSE